MESILELHGENAVKDLIYFMFLKTITKPQKECQCH